MICFRIGAMTVVWERWTDDKLQVSVLLQNISEKSVSRSVLKYIQMFQMLFLKYSLVTK